MYPSPTRGGSVHTDPQVQAAGLASFESFGHAIQVHPRRGFESACAPVQDETKLSLSSMGGEAIRHSVHKRSPGAESKGHRMDKLMQPCGAFNQDRSLSDEPDNRLKLS